MGFVKLPSNLSDWGYYYDNNTLSVYIRLLISAAWRDTDYKNIRLKRGQAVATIPKIAEQNGLTVQQTRTVLSYLKSSGKITVESTSKFSIITLIDYDCDVGNNSQNNSLPTGKQQANNRQATDEQQASNSLSTGKQQAPYINRNTEDKKIRSSEYYNTPLPPRQGESSENSVAAKANNFLSAEQQVLFDKFYSVYPKKTAKRNAIKAWKKLSPDKELVNKILAALEQQKRSVQWQKDGGQYIPYPATWLNGKRWEDDEEQNPTSTSQRHCDQPKRISKNPFINAVMGDREG